MGNETLNTVKGHGIKLGDVIMFHGMASDPTPSEQGTPVKFMGKVGTKYTLATIFGEIMTWQFGPSAKVWIDRPEHIVQVTARSMDNGDTVYVGQCEHGWQTGFHTSERDAHDVAAGHGTVECPLYVAPVAVEMTEDIGETGLVEVEFSPVKPSAKSAKPRRCPECGESTNGTHIHAGKGVKAATPEVAIPEIGTLVDTPNGSGVVESRYSDGAVNVVAGDGTGMSLGVFPADRVAPVAYRALIDYPTIAGYYWARHNGTHQVDAATSPVGFAGTDTWQLVKAGTTTTVSATITHVNGFRWRAKGCHFISRHLTPGWDGEPLAKAFERVTVYMAEVAAYAGNVIPGDPVDFSARMAVGERAHNGDSLSDLDTNRLITDRDMADQVSAAIRASGESDVAGTYDVDAIVAAIIEDCGRVDIDAVDNGLFWHFVARFHRAEIIMREQDAATDRAEAVSATIRPCIRAGLAKRKRKSTKRARARVGG